MPHQPAPEHGVILVNVLLFVALAASIVTLMIAAGDGAVARAGRLGEADRALAAAEGGEASAAAALRRDMLTGPDSDSRREPWAAVAQREVPIDGGSFDLAIGDACDRFNVNALMDGAVGPTTLLFQIAQATGVPRETAVKAMALVRLYGPLADLAPLERSGLDAATLTRLRPLLTALPGTTAVNLNSAPAELIAAMLNDPGAAQRLVARRDAQGYLTEADLAALELSLPPGASFTCNLFWVRTRVRIGDTAQQLTSLIQRKKQPDGRVTAQAIGRWLGARPPSQAPAL